MRIVDIAREPQAWHALSTFVGVTLAGLATWLMFSSCHRPDIATDASCAAKFTILVEQKWTIWFFVALVVMACAAAYYCLRGTGVCCDGVCNNNRHSVLLSLITTSCAFVYAKYVSDTARRFPTTFVTEENVCYVCLHRSVPEYHFMLWAAPSVMLFGWVVGLYVACAAGEHYSSIYRLKQASLVEEDS